MKNILITAGDNDGGSWCWHLDDISQLDNHPKVKRLVEQEVLNPSSWGINEDYESTVGDVLNDVTVLLKDKMPFQVEHIVYYYCRR